MSIGNIKSNISSVILIPYWIAEAIQRQGLALSDVLDYEKIRPSLSMHDMATFIAAQHEQFTLLYAGANGGNFAGPCYDDLNQAWRYYTGAWTVDREVAHNLAKTPSVDYEKVISYSRDGSVSGDVKARLYGQTTRSARYPGAFDVVNLAPKVVGIVVYPGYFDNQRIDLYQQHQLVKALLDVFYVQGAPYHEIASTSLFKRHLELLSGE